MTSKQRAYLKSLAMNTEPILQIGKSSLTPEFTASVKEALEARELIKISVEEGQDYYNFYGITGDFDESNPLNGLYTFKKGFGGHVEELIGDFYLPINWFYYFNKLVGKIRK